MCRMTTSLLLVLLATSVAAANGTTPIEIYRSAPVSGEQYFLDYTCDLINVGAGTITGQLRLIDGDGTTRATQPFNLDPLEVGTVDEVALFANGPRYCQAEVTGSSNGSGSETDAAPVPVRVIGALETTRQYAESVASTPLVRVSEHCNDGSLCTDDVFNGATGRCMHPPVCPPGGLGCQIGTDYPTVFVTTQRPECREPESTEAQHGSGESRTNVPAAGRPLVGGGS